MYSRQVSHGVGRYQGPPQGSELGVAFRGVYRGFPGGSDGKDTPYNAGDPGLIPGLGRRPGGWHGNPLQYSCPESPTDRGAWRATVQLFA